MALTKSVTLNTGVELTNAYMKVSEVHLYNHASDSSYVIINVNIFKDQTARESGKPEVLKAQYKVYAEFQVYFGLNVLSQEGKNSISQGYEYLKTLAFYSDATDVIDSKEV